MRPLRPAAAVLAAGMACAVLLPATATADDATVPGVLASTAVNTTSLDVPVPLGTTPRAITGVLTMPVVVDEGVVTFRVNGRIAKTVDSTLYAKVRIPVTASDVVADGTIGLSISSHGPAIEGICRPAAGAATFRKIAVDFSGKERQPTTLATFFPPSSAGILVLIADDADDDLLEAGIAAVAALASRYPQGTDIRLAPISEAPTSGTATQRVVVLGQGRAGEITTDIAVAPDVVVPTLAIAATGDDLSAAARGLALPQGSDTLQLADDPDVEGLTGQLGQREPNLDLTLAEAGADDVALSGYGAISQVLTLPQDAFSSPVSAMDVHLEGAHSAVDDPSRARLDVRLNGELVGSHVLDETGDLQMDFTVAAGRLRAVNKLELVLSAVTPDGLPCAAPGAPPIEVDISTADSTIRATAGRADTRGFQLLPQVLQSSLPIAIRSEGGQRFAAAQDAARIVAVLQHASVGTTSDATSLEAPLKLSSIRLLDQPDSSFEVTSQEPYAVLESFAQGDADERQVLMLGSWAPGNKAAPATLTSKLVGYLESTGWSALDGDLVMTDESATPFTVDSRTIQQEAAPRDETEERSYAKWIFAVVALLLLMLAFQVVVSIRRDRVVAHSDEVDDGTAGQPAYLEDLEFREQNLPPDEPPAPPPVEKPVKKPASKPVNKPAGTPPAKKTTPPVPPKVTKRSRNQKKKR